MENNMKTEWISVKDKLPEVNQFTLITWAGAKVPLIGCFKGKRDDNNAWLGSDSDFWIASDSEVTHWMPLPPSPES
jgi:hypothetical protein